MNRRFTKMGDKLANKKKKEAAAKPGPKAAPSIAETKAAGPRK